MATGNRDIIYSKVTLMTAAEFKHVFLCRRTDNINNPAVIFLLTQTFQHEVVSNWFLVLDKIVSPPTRLEHQRISVLADLALERFPEECLEIWASLSLSLYFEPAAKTLQVDKTHRTSTFT